MCKVLLVEDEKNFAHVLKDYLGMNGYEVTLATNGEEGLEAFAEGRFGLCVLDIMMPRKDGFSLAAGIREKDKDVPLIFLTARGMREDMLRGYRLGADDYIVKLFLIRKCCCSRSKPYSAEKALQPATASRYTRLVVSVLMQEQGR